jgi:hypothetical protein
MVKLPITMQGNDENKGENQDIIAYGFPQFTWVPDDITTLNYVYRQRGAYLHSTF